jgi:hypothetical protein
VRTYVHVYICMCIYTRVYTTYVHMYVYVYVCMYVQASRYWKFYFHSLKTLNCACLSFDSNWSNHFLLPTMSSVTRKLCTHYALCKKTCCLEFLKTITWRNLVQRQFLTPPRTLRGGRKKTSTCLSSRVACIICCEQIIVINKFMNLQFVHIS